MSTNRIPDKSEINIESRQDGHLSEVAGTPADQSQRGSVEAIDTSIQVVRMEEDFLIDATLISELLNVPVSEVHAGMQSGRITSVCESGIDADQGTYRLNLFYSGRHVRLRIDSLGRILHRSVINFGDGAVVRDRTCTKARRSSGRTEHSG